MPGHLLPKAVDHVRNVLKKVPTTDTLIATFSNSTSFYSPDALDNGAVRLRPDGGTALAKAVRDCQQRLAEEFPEAGQLSVYLITDLDVGNQELDELLRWASSEKTIVHIYTWPNEKVNQLAVLSPDLTRLVDYLPA